MVEVEFTDQFGEWWNGLDADEQDAVYRPVEVLRREGLALGFPRSSQIKSSRYALRELRIQHRGRAVRVLYAFDPRRVALLLIGGDKTGDPRFYDWIVPLAERLWEEHLPRDTEERGAIAPKQRRTRNTNMAHPWKEIRDSMDPERLARLDGEVDREILEMRLGELRKYVGELTQAEVAELLGVTQGAISQLEKRQDTLLSRLAEYVRVLGGRLELVAHFEGRKPIRITQFEGVREEIAQRALSE